MHAAIDFGISNTDAVAQAADGTLRRWTQPTDGPPTPALIAQILANGGIELGIVQRLAVTGGRHQELPAQLGTTAVIGVGEVPAIGRGGQVLAELAGHASASALVVSAGSGTAVVSARARAYAHVTGSAVGGGTLLGLSRLLLGTVDPHEIDALARNGDPNGADLSLADVVGGPIGRLPASATAVNFGRLARQALDVCREDLAAALVTLVGQVIAVTAINAARAQQLERVIVIGHLTDMPSVRNVLDLVGDWYGLPLTLPADAGYGTALGALFAAIEQAPG